MLSFDLIISAIIVNVQLLDVQQANPRGRPTLKPVNTEDITSPTMKASGQVHICLTGIKTGCTYIFKKVYFYFYLFKKNIL